MRILVIGINIRHIASSAARAMPATEASNTEQRPRRVAIVRPPEKGGSNRSPTYCSLSPRFLKRRRGVRTRQRHSGGAFPREHRRSVLLQKPRAKPWDLTPTPCPALKGRTANRPRKTACDRSVVRPFRADRGLRPFPRASPLSWPTTRGHPLSPR